MEFIQIITVGTTNTLYIKSDLIKCVEIFGEAHQNEIATVELISGETFQHEGPKRFLEDQLDSLSPKP